VFIISYSNGTTAYQFALPFSIPFLSPEKTPLRSSWNQRWISPVLRSTARSPSRVPRIRHNSLRSAYGTYSASPVYRPPSTARFFTVLVQVPENSAGEYKTLKRFCLPRGFCYKRKLSPSLRKTFSNSRVTPESIPTSFIVPTAVALIDVLLDTHPGSLKALYSRTDLEFCGRSPNFAGCPE